MILDICCNQVGGSCRESRSNLRSRAREQSYVNVQKNVRKSTVKERGRKGKKTKGKKSKCKLLFYGANCGQMVVDSFAKYAVSIMYQQIVGVPLGKIVGVTFSAG